jgi:predicted TIM-barrel fold metal-dependent hydrolase
VAPDCTASRPLRRRSISGVVEQGVVVEIDEPTLPALVPFVGEDRIVWGSDYPHHEATFPGAVNKLRGVIEPLPEDTQAKILGVNAAEMYRLP